MALYLRVLLSVFAAAVSLAPPPPTRPASLPAAGLETQTLGSNAGLSAAPSGAALLASHEQAHLRTVPTRMRMQGGPQLLPRMDGHSTVEKQSTGTRFAGTLALPKTLGTTPWKAVLGVFLLAAALAGGERWSRRQWVSDAKDMELGTFKQRFDVAAFAGLARSRQEGNLGIVAEPKEQLAVASFTSKAFVSRLAPTNTRRSLSPVARCDRIGDETLDGRAFDNVPDDYKTVDSQQGGNGRYGGQRDWYDKRQGGQYGGQQGGGRQYGDPQGGGRYGGRQGGGGQHRDGRYGNQRSQQGRAQAYGGRSQHEPSRGPWAHVIRENEPRRGPWLDVDKETLREAKKKKLEMDQAITAERFFEYRKRLLRMGVRPRDERYWHHEEHLLFTAGGNFGGAGKYFGRYDDVDVELRGGHGNEEPMGSFEAIVEKFGLPKALVENIRRCGFGVPTPVQKHALPVGLCGTDAMVRAETGSGKTAAYLIPMIDRAMRIGSAPLSDGVVAPSCVVLVPTRELCQQVAFDARRLCFRTSLRVCAAYGGTPAPRQLRELAEGCDILVCVPGRLQDFIKRGVLDMSRVQFLVVDEADRVVTVDLGQDVVDAMERMPGPGRGPGERQTLMFSATFPEAHQEFSEKLLDPSYMWIGVGRAETHATNVEQRFEYVPGSMVSQPRFEAMLESLEKVKGSDGDVDDPGKILIFANGKRIVERIGNCLYDNGYDFVEIHGGIEQVQRDRALRAFRSGRANVLVSTDLAARGLDIPGVCHVVNFQLPRRSSMYAHRIGRTGRIGNRGVATSLVGDDEPALECIAQQLEDAFEEDPENAVPVPGWIKRRVDRGINPDAGFGSRGTPRKRLLRHEEYDGALEWVEEDDSASEAARSWNRMTLRQMLLEDETAPDPGDQP